MSDAPAWEKVVSNIKHWASMRCGVVPLLGARSIAIRPLRAFGIKLPTLAAHNDEGDAGFFLHMFDLP